MRNIMIGCLLFTCGLVAMIAFGEPLAKISIRVIDEAGKQVEAANVGMGFIVVSKGWQSTDTNKEGLTDREGVFAASGASSIKRVGYSVEKEGYYQSAGNYEFKQKGLLQWEPWNPEVKVVLRKIDHPVPMFARNSLKSHLEIPASNKQIGFDLAKYDWVAPYGQGNIADMIFKLQKSYTSERDFDCTLTVMFLNKYDGMQIVKQSRATGSQFMLARYAPEAGYQQKYVFKHTWLPNKSVEETYDEDNNYYLRVRSEVRDGKLARAMYGKIIGDIRFDPRKSSTAEIYFTYYLNPDYTTNLEFNGHNLFTNLSDREQVSLR